MILPKQLLISKGEVKFFFERFFNQATAAASHEQSTAPFRFNIFAK